MKKIIVLALILTNFGTFAQSKNDNVLRSEERRVGKECCLAV